MPSIQRNILTIIATKTSVIISSRSITPKLYNIMDVPSQTDTHKFVALPSHTSCALMTVKFLVGLHCTVLSTFGNKTLALNITSTL